MLSYIFGGEVRFSEIHGGITFMRETISKILGGLTSRGVEKFKGATPGNRGIFAFWMVRTT